MDAARAARIACNQVMRIAAIELGEQLYGVRPASPPLPGTGLWKTPARRLGAIEKTEMPPRALFAVPMAGRGGAGRPGAGRAPRSCAGERGRHPFPRAPST
jgi:hypothetical protein